MSVNKIFINNIKMISGLAIAGIVLLCILVVGGLIVTVLWAMGYLNSNAASLPDSQTMPDGKMMSPETEWMMSQPVIDPTADMAAGTPTTGTPTTGTPTTGTPTTGTPTTGTPTTAITPTLSTVQSLYVDRGCWKDGGFLYGSPNADPEDAFNRALGTDNVILLDPAMLPEEYFGYGVQQAVAGRFDTFAITQGWNGPELRLGKYGTLDSRGNMCKYDKFGPAPAESVCPETLTGDIYINRVYSIIAPYSAPVGVTRHTADEFVDRGCYVDGDPYNVYKLQGALSFGGPVAGGYIIMDATSEPRENWFNYAVQLAIEGCYDTFAFQTDISTQNVYLYLGYYGPVYRYDRFGKMSTTVQSQIGCAEFGFSTYIRVYSAAAPALTTISSPKLSASASDWLLRRKSAGKK